MLGLFLAQGAAESDASVHLRVRSHVPGTRRDRAQAEDAGIKKAKPEMRLLSKESAYGPSGRRVRPRNRRLSSADSLARGSAARRSEPADATTADTEELPLTRLRKHT